MLEMLKAWLDAAKATTYELLALLLPGGVVLAGLEGCCDIDIPFGTMGAIAASHIFGTILQAIADYALKRDRIAKWVEGDKSVWKPSQEYGHRLIQKRLEAVPAAATLDVCLTRVGVRRSIYDKFITLRDTARGLAFASLITSVLVIIDKWPTLAGGSTAYAIVKITAEILLAFSLFLAFVQRYSRFHPLALQAVYGQFIATRLDTAD